MAYQNQQWVNHFRKLQIKCKVFNIGYVASYNQNYTDAQVLALHVQV